MFLFYAFRAAIDWHPIMVNWEARRVATRFWIPDADLVLVISMQGLGRERPEYPDSRDQKTGREVQT
jgi:hypothetical protein